MLTSLFLYLEWLDATNLDEATIATANIIGNFLGAQLLYILKCLLVCESALFFGKRNFSTAIQDRRANLFW